MPANTQSDHITLDEFHAAITSAAQQRNSVYNSYFSLSIRWKDDDTGAHKDTAHFQSILKTLGLPSAKELILQPTDRTPGWTVQDSMVSMLEAAKKSQGRALILCHYAGHAYFEKRTFLATAQVDGKPMNLGAFCLDLALDDMYYLADIDHVDVVFLLDCCYRFERSRAPPNGRNRIVEVLATTEETTGSLFAMSPVRNTLTGRLAGEIARRKQEGHHFVELAELVQTLRGREDIMQKPVHGLTMGASSVCLPFFLQLPATVDTNATPEPPALRAVFSISVSETMTKEQLAVLVSWMQTLPPRLALTLDAVYQTTSTCLVIQGAYSVYSKLRGIKGVRLVTESETQNLLSLGGSSSSSSSSTSVAFV